MSRLHHCLLPILISLLFYSLSYSIYICHRCNTMFYNFPVTIETLPVPTEDQCDAVKAIHGCYIHVEWYPDGSSEVYYRLDPPFPFDTILTVVEGKRPFAKSKQVMQRSIGYSCRSNTIACNTIDHLRRAILATTFPTQPPLLLANRTSCFKFSNGTRCHKAHHRNCRYCSGFAEYNRETQFCASCEDEKTTSEFFNYSTLFFLKNRTRLDRIHVACDQCSTLTMMRQIRDSMNIHFDFHRFFNSTRPRAEPNVALLVVIISLAYLVHFVINFI